MYNLNVGIKTGYKVKDGTGPINIRDDKGVLFYTTEPFFENGKTVSQFNLPPGKYLVDSGSFSPLPFPVAYGRIPLPLPQRVMPKNPDTFKIVFGNNPAKCSILWGENTILFDNSFKEQPLPIVEFIYGHEKGHRWYGGFDQKTQPKKYEQAERFCDWYSANRMLSMGYNPSQIGSSPIDSLSDNAIGRKNAMVSKLSTI